MTVLKPHQTTLLRSNLKMKESMKTKDIVMAILAGASMLVTSCNIERESDFEKYSIAEDEVAFKIARIQTRSQAEARPVASEVASIRTQGSEKLSLEETISSLDYDFDTPETRGTPAYTENVTKVYPTLYAVAMKEDGTAAFAKGTDLVNGVAYSNEKDNVYSHRYGEDIWDGKLPTDFFMRMPGTGDGVTLGTNPYSQAEGSISFSYTSPAEAEAQKDILFAWYKRTGETNCEDVTFYHALTGIKFSNFYTNKGLDNAKAITKTVIKEVTLSGVANTGDCKMVLKDAASSKTAALWSNVDGSATFKLSYSDTTDYKNSSKGLDTLLNATAKARNINKEDGSLTFWVVPQEFEDNTVMITMTCDIELDRGTSGKTTTVKDTTITVSLGARTWQAGELHTFTLKPVIVGVKLEDHMDEDGFVKSDVRVDNTGNVYEYVRVNMIGNWVGKVFKGPGDDDYETEDVILMGFTTSDEENDTEVEFWNDKDGFTHYGEFTLLTPKSEVIPASAANTVNGWVRYDKYYYYTKPIGPNDAITDQLFEKYEVGPSPEFWIVDKWGERRKAKDVNLVIDIMVQAIPAPVDENGNVLDNTDNQGYIRAWLEALDFEPTTSNYSKLLDL